MSPELSVIIPVLNEAACLPALFSALERQQKISLQLIFSDGGSSDASTALIHAYQRHSKHRVEWITGSTGRAVQMNRAARRAVAPCLLFLHADSFWLSELWLYQGLQRYHAACATSDGCFVAAHFTMEFSGSGSDALIYRYLAEKAALNWPGTIFGDQGVLITQLFWQQLGGFSETLPLFEDVVLAQAVWDQGRWELLPGVIFSSNRRYRNTGVCKRLLDNMWVMIVGSTGYFSLLATLSHGYSGTVHCDDPDGPRRFFDALRQMSLTDYLRFWYGCAGVVAGYSWLVPYAASWLVVYLGVNRRRALIVWYSRVIVPRLRHPGCRGLLAVSGWLLFYLAYLCCPGRWSCRFLRKSSFPYKENP